MQTLLNAGVNTHHTYKILRQDSENIEIIPELNLCSKVGILRYINGILVNYLYSILYLYSIMYFLIPEVGFENKLYPLD